MKLITTLSSILALLFCHSSMAETTNNTTKSTATLSSSCSLSTQNISFGTLMTPLTSQSSSGTMNVLCTKNTSYSISLYFGISSNYWVSTGGGGKWVDSIWSYSASEYDSTGKLLKTTTYSAPKGTGSTPQGLSTGTGCQWIGSVCYATNEQNNSSTVGILAGASKGDSVPFSAYQPDNPTKIWGSGTNAYSSTGIGSIQSFPILLKIVPGSSNYYPAPDMYSSTVTTTITY